MDVGQHPDVVSLRDDDRLRIRLTAYLKTNGYDLPCARHGADVEKKRFLGLNQEDIGL